MTRVGTGRLACAALSTLVRSRTVGLTAPSRVWRARAAARSLQASAASTIAINAALDPDGPALFDEDGMVTWTELDRRAQRLARVLIESGAGPDRAVALMARNHRGFIETLAGSARASADVVALNTEFTGGQLSSVLGQRDIAVVVHDEEFGDRVEEAEWAGPSLVAWTTADGGNALSMRTSRADPFEEAPTRRSQIVILTSGTTGVPRGASRDIPAKSLLGALVTLARNLRFERRRPVLVAPPLFHGFALGVAMIAQTVGAPIVVRRHFDATAMVDAVVDRQVTTLVGVPVMLRRIARLDPAPTEKLASLRSVLSAGAPLSVATQREVMAAMGPILHNAYGSTETGFGATADPADLAAAPGCVGRAPLGADVVILDDSGRPVPDGQTGRVCVGGDLNFDGYTTGGTKETFDGMMDTGDLGHLDEGGRLHIDGRADDMIVSGGENVFPAEVEAALAEHDRVDEVVVVGVPDAEFGQRLRAFVVARDAVTSDELVEHVRSRLERYKVPRSIDFVEELPRTATGKVLRRLLIEEDV